MKFYFKPILLLSFIGMVVLSYAQPITGVWRGKVIKGNGLLKQAYKLELKLIKNGDSITGTSYYYASANNYARYTVKGVFGTTDNSISWWDDQLIESKSAGFALGSVNKTPLLSTADFNCPGGRTMLLNGKSHPVNGEADYEMHLQKFENPDFRDEWDPIIEDFFVGGADPKLIDSVGKIAFKKPVVIEKEPEDVAVAPKETTVYQPSQPKEPKQTTNSTVKKTIPPAPAIQKEELPEQPTTPPAEPLLVKKTPTIEDKFSQRKLLPAITIPVSGEMIEFRFYDNAEVDGDSIAVFLNGKLLYSHIRLTDKAYTLKIAVADLGADNDLVMVAENLGAIPPNTAYMEAWSGGQRYSARLESTENSSAVIKLKRE